MFCYVFYRRRGSGSLYGCPQRRKESMLCPSGDSHHDRRHSCKTLIGS